MSPGEVFTAAGALIAFGGLITWVKVLRDHVKELREWRHSVGEKPGYAAFERLTATNERVDDMQDRIERLERRVFNGRRKTE